MFVKLGESLEIIPSDIVTYNTSIHDDMINEAFRKTAQELKKIAPKAEDFLYFSAIMMHSAEAAMLEPDGSIKKDAFGDPIKVGWEKKGDSWRWKSTDSNIKPYRNANGDIFPEEELLKAYKNWIGKPLCVDHKSSSVDAIRGLIVDTYYDYKFKRVIALCALDKINYPDLARKVSSQYAASVSMGTGVGKAICSDCGTVARTADDFCIHMRNKSCYGEINLDLSPIELSIVVNGADPKAKIKHIIASANNINKYIEDKQSLISKGTVSQEEANKILLEIQAMSKRITELKDQLTSISSDQEINDVDVPVSGTTDAPYGMSSGTVSTEGEEFQAQPGEDLGTPPARFAGDETLNLLNKINDNIQKMASKLDSIKKVSETTNNSANTVSEKKMTMNKEGYFQGAGGVNEPTPGQPKYEKDPLNEKARSEDKQMVGQHNMDTGPVDGLHPGTESSGMSDLQRKEMLLRAEKEQRALRRAAALESAKETLTKTKEAYFQGGGKENEPTPGKPKYPVDPLNEKAREEDKQMVGQKPFPDVGKVDGLHPSPASAAEKDELERKKMLARAGVTLRFVKAANTDGTENKGESAWQVYNDGKLVMTTTVDELTNGKSDILYEAVATKEFGQKMLSTIKSLGFDKAKSLYKKAQDMAPPAPETTPPVEMPMSPDMAPPVDMAPADLSKDGDPKEAALALAEQVRDASSDLAEAVKALTGDQSEVSDVEEMPKAASIETKAMAKIQKDLGAALLVSLKNCVAELDEHGKELTLIHEILDDGQVNKSNETSVSMIVNDLFADAKQSIVNAHELMASYIKFARGTELVVKRAQAEVKLQKKEGSVEGETMNADVDLDALLADLDESVLDKDIDNLEVTYADDGKDSNDAVDGTVVKLQPGTPVPTGAKAVTAEFDLKTKEGRAAYRAKLAAEADFAESDMPGIAHPKGGFTTELDTKPTGDLAKVETLDEVHSKMMDVVKADPKVKKQAEEIQAFVVEGKLAKEDVEALVAQGVDPEAVKYWKSFYGEEGKSGSQFATELTKDHVKAAVEKEMATYKVKIARAYSLAYEMMMKGQVAENADALSAQAEEIMQWNDEGFDSMKKLISKQAFKKQASLPNVGLINDFDSHQAPATMYDELSQIFAQPGKRY